jgi:pyruvate dehydrogenase E2 component (dihydrolipoamide acetyltransferase)
MALPVIMPKQGQSVETCIITQWFKKKGDTVKTGDVLFSYETDKAAFDAEAQADGVLLDVFFHDGDEVPVLSNVAVIGKVGESAADFGPESAVAANLSLAGGLPDQPSSPHPPLSPSSPPAQTLAQTPAQTPALLRISPRARKMAASMGVDPMVLKGTGPNGRIIVRDVEMLAGQVTDSKGQTHGPVPASEYSDKKLSNVRKIIARAMHESISTSAQLTHHLSADVRKLLALRSQVKTALEKGSTVNITLNDMVCYAVIRALEQYPEVNSHFLGETIRTFANVHLGIAVDTPRGLMVPVVQNAGNLSLKGLSASLREVADQCRKGSINPELLSSTAASFTVSNLGNYGVEMFTPIINLPQVAILGVNTIMHRPADLGNGIFGFVPMIGLSLTYDHRAVDGGPATLFLRAIKEQIENFEEKI